MIIVPLFKSFLTMRILHLTSLLLAFFFLAGCSSVPLTGRKQMLLVSDNDVLASGVYAKVFRNWNRGFDYVGFSPDGFSTAEEGFFRFLDMYMSTGEVVPLSAVVIDDFRLSGYAASINEVASRVRSSTTDEHAVYRAILADDFKVIDAVSSIARSCYRTLRKENLFTHIIRYPLSEEYAIVRSPEANADIKYIEYNHIYVH